jgi:hypothetical protein
VGVTCGGGACADACAETIRGVRNAISSSIAVRRKVGLGMAEKCTPENPG